MKRREFIRVLGGIAAAWPFAAGAQQPGKSPAIGFLGGSAASAQRQWTSAFVERLRELGWIEAQTVFIEYRWADGHFERAPEMFAEFVRLKVDIIVTHSTANVVAAKKATSTIPIIFATAGDPVGNGLVASLARPGGNVTGLSVQAPDLAGKRLDLLREVFPGFRRLAILANVDNPITLLEVREAKAAAATLGIEVDALEVRRAEDIAPAIDAAKRRADVLYMPFDPLITNQRHRINTLALGARLPTIAGTREYVEPGGLMSYGPSIPVQWRRTADLADKILRGAKPADIPVEQPTKFDLVINLITARALGLTLPPTLIARADEVIE